MEIVFAPELRYGEEAAALIKELIVILKSHGICSCKMEGNINYRLILNYLITQINKVQPSDHSLCFGQMT